MGAAYFYHLTRHPVDVTLAMLLGKAMGAGWRIAVRARDQDRLRWLDDKLWQGSAVDFLPHAMAGGDFDAQQPILLCTDKQPEMKNNPQCVMAIDGAEVTAQEVQTLERVCIIFDGLDEQALAQARHQWKTLKDAGVSAQYWSQADGAWEKKAET